LVGGGQGSCVAVVKCTTAPPDLFQRPGSVPHGALPCRASESNAGCVELPREPQLCVIPAVVQRIEAFKQIRQEAAHFTNIRHPLIVYADMRGDSPNEKRLLSDTYVCRSA
jgi:hypothetical protein